ADDVVRYSRRLRQRGARTDPDHVVRARIAELDPALQDVDEMRAHVVPVPARRRLERANGADVLGADHAAARRRPTQIAVFDIGARAVARKVLVAAGETRQCLRERPRPLVARRQALAAVALTKSAFAGG